MHEAICGSEVLAGGAYGRGQPFEILRFRRIGDAWVISLRLMDGVVRGYVSCAALQAVRVLAQRFGLAQAVQTMCAFGRSFMSPTSSARPPSSPTLPAHVYKPRLTGPPGPLRLPCPDRRMRPSCGRPFPSLCLAPLRNQLRRRRA